jgi:hypothetical protein
MLEFSVTFSSERNPLVVHNIRLASPLDPYSQQLKRLNAKRQRTEDDYLAVSRVEWEGGMYYDAEGVYLPVSYPQRILRESAKITRDGKRVERAVICMAEDGGSRIPLSYEPQISDLDEMWEDDRFRDVRMVSVGQSKVLRTRPRFENWSLTFLATVEESLLDVPVFEEIAQRAGRLIGIGEAPEGVRARFDVEVVVREGGAEGTSGLAVAA